MRGVSHWFGEGENRKQILFDVDLDVRRGEIMILTGPSGSGKTTLLTLVGALRSIQEGSLRVHGTELRGLSGAELVDMRRNIGFIFQAHNLFDALTAHQNVRLGLELHDHAPAEMDRLATEALGRLGLGHRLQNKPRALSGGQRQRVAVARAIVSRPKVILADEPTAALDKDAGREVVNLFQQLAAEDGCAILMVTHDNRILDVADRIVNMVDGRVASDVAVKQSLEICEFLVKSSVFASSSPDVLTEVSQRMAIERWPAGHRIIREGDEGDKFYMLRRGSADAYQTIDGREEKVGSRSAGEFFGETALLTDAPRNATVVAREDVELYVLDKQSFKSAVEKSRSFADQLREIFFRRG